MNTSNLAIVIRVGQPGALFWPLSSSVHDQGRLFPLQPDVLIGFLHADGRWYSELDRYIWESSSGIGLGQPMRYGRYPQGGFASHFHQKVGEMDSSDVITHSGKAIFVQGPRSIDQSYSFFDVAWGIVNDPNDLRTALANAIGLSQKLSSADLPHLVLPFYGASQTVAADLASTHEERVLLAQHRALVQVQGLRLAARQVERPTQLTILLPPKEEREINWEELFAYAADISHLDDFAHVRLEESME